MDIECPNCGEPWDRHHLLKDEPNEWGLSDYDLKEIVRTGRFVSENDRTLKAAQAAGWEFAGNSLLSFTQCPCCKKRRSILGAADQVDQVRNASFLLNDDPDGLASTLSS